LVQVDYARVVDLDIGAGKSDNLRDQSGHHFGARRQNSGLQPPVGLETAMENVKSIGRPATDGLKLRGKAIVRGGAGTATRTVCLLGVILT
jgi:hypothetical protein